MKSNLKPPSTKGFHEISLTGDRAHKRTRPHKPQNPINYESRKFRSATRNHTTRYTQHRANHQRICATRTVDIHRYEHLSQQLHIEVTHQPREAGNDYYHVPKKRISHLGRAQHKLPTACSPLPLRRSNHRPRDNPFLHRHLRRQIDRPIKGTPKRRWAALRSQSSRRSVAPGAHTCRVHEVTWPPPRRGDAPRHFTRSWNKSTNSTLTTYIEPYRATHPNNRQKALYQPVISP